MQIDAIDKRLEEIDSLMIEYGFDYEKLHELQLEKESLESEYERIFEEMEE